MQWTKVIFAGLMEVVWVIGLTHSHLLYQWILTIALISLSFWMMVSASRILPVGTVYAVFVGIGTLGTVIVGMLFFNESVSFIKLCFILTLLIGVIGLKLTTDQAVNSNELVRTFISGLI
ncbi:multidrug efflux SMR transporter [Staphylococcus pseudintermedius]|nr:multidrug efflux SMR transporter [Staphylococcus pseudintermedius]